MSRIIDCLQKQNGNYVLPFFWQHGEEEAVLREYMRVIHDANIREVCLEARPHPDYAGEGWFRDVDIILDEAKKLDMKLWILDDAHFPSGQCAGKLLEEPVEYQKQYVKYHAADIAGPVKAAFMQVDVMAKEHRNPFATKSMFDQSADVWYDDDALFAVVAAKQDGDPKSMHHLDGELLDLTSQVCDGMLTWDVPEGTWRVFVLYTTRNGGGRTGYVNFMSAASCRKQIEYCYEPHYARYKDEFGKTILGFFSDEPEVGNVSGYNIKGSTIGDMEMALPWSEEMPALMQERFGEDYAKKMLALWFPVGSEEFTADMRVGYMDIATRQCKKNFAGQIGQWCREHGVEYIGHVIEDNDQHTRFGGSQGHFFRALWGQDWSGIDNISGQVTLGGANVSHQSLGTMGANGTFYHQVLGKLGTSLADLDVKKQGRSMCEIFGAYGWEEGTRLMKYEMDHYLVRGINHYVPHAFSPKAFPDPDCPPHFYAHGKNPLYKPFGTLMAYTNRVCHLISGGVHEVKVGLLYHAESLWAGTPYMDMEKPARVLNEHQIDFDIVPADTFTEVEDYHTSLDEQGLHIGRTTLKSLVIPGAAYVPEAVRDFAVKAKAQGFPVFFVERVPDGIEGAEAVALAALPELLTAAGCADVILSDSFADLQVYHYTQEAETCYLISNESASAVYEGELEIRDKGKLFRYDAMENRLYAMDAVETSDGMKVSARIEPYEMWILVVPKRVSEDVAVGYEELAVPTPVAGSEKLEIEGPWRVSMVENENYPAFGKELVMDPLVGIQTIDPAFSGVIRYETTFMSPEGTCPKGICQLELEQVYESAEVWVNGKYVGERICPPYRFDLTGLCHNGENSLRIEVRTTLERKVHTMTGGQGFLGPDMKILPPSGLVGKVVLR